MTSQNTVKTVFLVLVLTGIFIFVGNMAGGRGGAVIALVLSLAMNLGMYWFSDKIVLRMHSARPIGPRDPSGVFEIVQDLSMRAGLPMPSVYLIPEVVPNAFATGRDPAHAAVAVTEGIVRLLSPRELRGVLAHELSHVRNRDTLISTIVAGMASAIMWIASIARWGAFLGAGRSDDEDRGGANPIVFLLTIFLAPLAAMFIQMWISRTREYQADASGAAMSTDPESLASALEKISDPRLMQSIAQAGAMPQPAPAMNHLYIVNNFSGRSLLNVFSTHPPVENRVRRLRAMRFV
ncbi:MAG: zinc metalloprotease HtpX [Acidobacteriota bacterium]